MELQPPVRRKLEEQIQVFRDRGYTGEFVGRDGQIVCRNCSALTLLEDLPVIEEHRFPEEGAQDEEAVLQAVTCPTCQVSGQLLRGHRSATV